MFLNAATVSQKITSGAIHFDGVLRGDNLLLTMGGPYQKLRFPGAAPVSLNTASYDIYGDQISDWRELLIDPGELILAQAREQMSLPQDLVGLLGTLSHVARMGLTVHLGSYLIEPGFVGHITFELINYGLHSLSLRPKDPVAKVKLANAMSGVGDLGFYGELGVLASRTHEEVLGVRNVQRS